MVDATQFNCRIHRTQPIGVNLRRKVVFSRDERYVFDVLTAICLGRSIEEGL